MGRCMAKTALSHNDTVVVVGRMFENRHDEMNKLQEDNKDCLGLLCDVRVRETVARVIEQTIEAFGRIDVVANCAGYGVVAASEDQDEYDIRNQFETNFMGTLNIVQLTMPLFRERRKGRYLIFSSTSGSFGVPGLGPYCASKYAVEGLMESMCCEVDSFNINITLLESGHMRRDDPGDSTSHSHRQAEEGNSLSSRPPLYNHFLVKTPSALYNTPTAPASHAMRMLFWLGDKQPASTSKAAELVWQLGHCSYPPLRLILGTYAVESIKEKMRYIIEEIEDWKHLNFSLKGNQPSNYDAAAQNEDPEAAGLRECE